MRSKRMRYKMPSVSCFPCDISAWKFMLAYIYMTVTLREAGVGDYSKQLIAAEKCIVESEKLIERLEKKY